MPPELQAALLDKRVVFLRGSARRGGRQRGDRPDSAGVAHRAWTGLRAVHRQLGRRARRRAVGVRRAFESLGTPVSTTLPGHGAAAPAGPGADRRRARPTLRAAARAHSAHGRRRRRAQRRRDAGACRRTRLSRQRTRWRECLAAARRLLGRPHRPRPRPRVGGSAPPKPATTASSTASSRPSAVLQRLKDGDRIDRRACRVASVAAAGCTA